MKKNFFQLLPAIILFACTNGDAGHITTVKNVTIVNVGNFVITDTALANDIGNVDTIPESSLNNEQLRQLVPLQFDSIIAAKKLKDYTSYDQIIHELIARGKLKAVTVIGDTSITKPTPVRIPLFEKVSTEKLLETRSLVQTLEKAIYNDRSFPISFFSDTPKINYGKNVLFMVSKSRLPANILSRKTTGVAINREQLSIARLYNICADSKRWRYDDNIQFSECTAFAISEDLVLTAGHCLNASNFHNYYFMFGFEIEPSGSIILDSSKIYSPIEFIDGIPNTAQGIDFALLRVNKKIPKDKIFPCSSSNSIMSDDKFYMVGHPMGTFTKISIDGTLLENTNRNFFLLGIDAFGGNSGSPVLNERENKVKGILISGNADLIEGECSEFVFCSQNTPCSGERVFRISNVFERPRVRAYLAQHPLGTD